MSHCPMKDRAAGEYKSVRALSRGLELLRLLSTAHAGRAAAAELSKTSGIHRTTVRRILETLADEGYLARSPSDDSFRLAAKVTQLGHGFSDAHCASIAALPVLDQLLAELQWPTDLCTPNGIDMVISESTQRSSRLSFHHFRELVRHEIPMLRTAAGRAYFAHLEEAQRRAILQEIVARGDAEDLRLAMTPGLIDTMVAQVRGRGYGINDGEFSYDARVGALAVPVLRDNRVVASLNVIYLRSVITTESAVERFHGPLSLAASRIEAGMRAMLAPVTDSAHGPVSAPDECAVAT
jgi:IclR family mhp operon transcriptional activator